MKLLIFSDIHTDRKAVEKLMAIEADVYVCAGDLVNWARGLDGMAELLNAVAEPVKRPSTNQKIFSSGR